MFEFLLPGCFGIVSVGGRASLLGAALSGMMFEFLLPGCFGIVSVGGRASLLVAALSGMVFEFLLPECFGIVSVGGRASLLVASNPASFVTAVPSHLAITFSSHLNATQSSSSWKFHADLK